MRFLAPNDVSSLLGDNVAFLDVRSPWEFWTVRARGTTSLPIRRIQRDPSLIAKYAGTAKRIVFVCKSDVRAAKAARLAEETMQGDIIVVRGGTDAWIEEGLDLVQGFADARHIAFPLKAVAVLLALAGLMLSWALSPWFLIAPAIFGMACLFFWSRRHRLRFLQHEP